MNEDEFMRQVTDLASICGWQYVHFRPARTAHGWATPVSGPLGKGWPDLILVRMRDGRRIAAELKVGRNQVAAAQAAVLAVLAASGFETFVWRPADFDSIVEILR